MIEEWRPVAGYEWYYEVSNVGRVRSLDRIDSKGCRRIGADKGVCNGTRGYKIVKLCRDGDGKTKKVHQLVAAAFIGPRPDGAEVLHGDGNPANNVVSNLRYGTHLDNMRDSIKHGTKARGELSNRTHLTEDAVRLMKIMGRAGARSQRMAEMFGLNPRSVNLILSGRRWAHVA